MNLVTLSLLPLKKKMKMVVINKISLVQGLRIMLNSFKDGHKDGEYVRKEFNHQIKIKS